MKNSKKLFALLLAVVMMLALGTTALAADKTAPIEGSNHTYTAYKIFAGTQTADEDDATLGAVVWGNGINVEAFLAALKESTAFGTTNPFAAETVKTAADVALVMADWADKSDNAKAFAKLAEDYVVADNGVACENGVTLLAAGYYLVVDTTASVAADDAYNVALLQLTKKGTFEIAAKNSVPEVEKKIVEDNAKVDAKVDANNAAIGDVVNYEISTAVPVEASEYEYYFFIIRDTLSKGLTLLNTAEFPIVVTIGDEVANAGTDYTLKTGTDAAPYTFQIALTDAIANAGDDVVVTYSATVNADAEIGTEGNPNAVDVQFSNNPNEDFGKDDIPTNGFPKDESHKPNGVTPKDYTITYVSQLKIFKVDENTKPLNGAEFTLSGDGLNKVLVFKEVFTAVEEGGEYYKLKNGTFTKDAPVADSYRVATEADGRESGYVLKEGNYVGASAEELADESVQLYIKVNGTAGDYESTETMYKMELKSEEQTAAGDTLSVTAKVDANGEVTFTGLPAGDYTLSETVVPAGYNPIDDIDFTITWTAPTAVAEGTEKCTWSVENNSEITYNATEDAFEITIVNQKGATLPETGGVGTTIFYVLGSILLVGAVVLLITKKRMGAED